MNPLADLNGRYTATAFRFEVLRSDPTDHPALRSIHNDPYLRRVAQHELDGKERDRVIVVAEPLTPETGAQLELYAANVAVGEGVAVVPASAATVQLGPDFWLFDEDTDHAEAVVMHYDEAGRVVDREHVTDPARVAELRRRAKLARRNAVDLAQYLAAGRVRRAG